MRCSISGRFADLEIPLLTTSFYLFRKVWPPRFTARGSSSKRAGLLARDVRGRQRQVGSLAGAAHLLNDNTGVLRLAQ